MGRGRLLSSLGDNIGGWEEKRDISIVSRGMHGAQQEQRSRTELADLHQWDHVIEHVLILVGKTSQSEPLATSVGYSSQPRENNDKIKPQTAEASETSCWPSPTLFWLSLFCMEGQRRLSGRGDACGKNEQKLARISTASVQAPGWERMCLTWETWSHSELQTHLMLGKDGETRL